MFGTSSSVHTTTTVWPSSGGCGGQQHQLASGPVVQHQSLTLAFGDTMEVVREQLRKANRHLEEVRKGLVGQTAREMVVLTDLEEWLGKEEEARGEVIECEEVLKSGLQ